MILRLCSLWLKTAEGWAGLVGAEGPAQVRWGNMSDHEPVQIMMFLLQYSAYMKGLIEGSMRLGSLDWNRSCHTIPMRFPMARPAAKDLLASICRW